MAGLTGDLVLCDCTFKDHNHFVTCRQYQQHQLAYPRCTGLQLATVDANDDNDHVNLRSLLRIHGQEGISRSQNASQDLLYTSK